MEIKPDYGCDSGLFFDPAKPVSVSSDVGLLPGGGMVGIYGERLTGVGGRGAHTARWRRGRRWSRGWWKPRRRRSGRAAAGGNRGGAAAAAGAAAPATPPPPPVVGGIASGVDANGDGCMDEGVEERRWNALRVRFVGEGRTSPCGSTYQKITTSRHG